MIDQPNYIWEFDRVSSTLDVAMRLSKNNWLKSWDSVFSKEQVSGRGQLRRYWQSIEGNIHATIRLPKSTLFDSSASSIAIGSLFVKAFRELGYLIHLKWPNDLVYILDSKPVKIGGILVESRGDIILAGIGINVLYSPDKKYLREDRALSVSNLSHCLRQKVENFLLGFDLWKVLVKHVVSTYNNTNFQNTMWLDLANEYLLWRGEKVELIENQTLVFGILQKIDFDGSVILEQEGKCIKYFGCDMHCKINN